MAVAAPMETLQPRRSRAWWLAAFVVVASAAALTWSVLDEPTLDDQVAALAAFESNDISPGPEFLRHETAPVADGEYAALTAVYTEDSGYDLHVFAEPDAARAEFRENLVDYARWPEAQEVNTYDSSERCYSARQGTFCFGFDGTRALRSYTWETSDPDGMEALLLLRTARKHWYGVLH